MNWKFWQPKPPATAPKPEIKVVVRESSKLTLSEFRGNAALVGEGRRVLTNPALAVMLQVLANEHPGNHVLHPNTPEHVRASKQAQCEGYTMCLANLESMGALEEPVKELEAEFEAEEHQQK